MKKTNSNVNNRKRQIELIHKFLQLTPNEQQQVIDRIKEIVKH